MVKRKVWLLTTICTIGIIGCDAVHALEGHLDYKKIPSSDYSAMALSTAPSASIIASTTFYGYATDLTIRTMAANNALAAILGFQFMRNINEVDITSMTLSGNQTITEQFYVPTSSPTVITYEVIGGATLQFKVGGLKTDR